MVQIYMYLESTNRVILVEKGLKDYWQAVDHCRIYFNRNPKDYLIYSYGKWFIYDPENNYGEPVEDFVRAA